MVVYSLASGISSFLFYCILLVKLVTKAKADRLKQRRFGTYFSKEMPNDLLLFLTHHMRLPISKSNSVGAGH